MLRKPPKLQHVKHVLRKGKWYSYFDTGTKTARGQIIRKPLPPWGTVGFHDSYAGFLAGRSKRKVKTDTVADLAADYLRSATFTEKAEATKASYRTQIKKVVAVWGDFPVNDLQPADVRKALENEGWNPGTRAMVLAQIGTLYLWAREQERATVDPVKDLKRPKGGAHKPWPEDVLEAALSSTDDTVRLAVHLLYFTGQRISDVCRMRWGDIRGGHVFVKQGKTGKIVEPKLSQELKAELDRTARDGILIMGGIGPEKLRGILQDFTSKLGVVTVPHGLRKNAVIALLEIGCTIAEVAAITGQTHQIVEQYAAEVNRKKLSSAAILKWDSARNKSG